MFTDTHAHLTYLEPYKTDKSALLTNLKNMNVSRVMAIMCEFSEFDDIKAWTDVSNDDTDIGMSVGLHPCQDKEILANVTVEKLLDFNHEKVWAFGETGLDYHWDDTKKTSKNTALQPTFTPAKPSKNPSLSTHAPPTMTRLTY